MTQWRNDPVDPAGLPAWRETPLQPVARRFAPYRALTVGGRWCLLAVAVAVAPPIDGVPVAGDTRVAGLVAALAVVSALLAWIEASRRGWALREHDLIHASGLIVRRTVVLPFRRVQHVESVSGPVERIFGLVRVTCHTAGGMSAALVVGGLQAGMAERVRQFLLARISAGDGAGRDV